MEDVLFKLFKVKADDFQNYKTFLSKQGVSICRVTYDFSIGKDQIAYWKLIEEKIAKYKESYPIIVFLKKQSQVKELKAIAARQRLTFYDAMTEAKLLQARSYLRQEERGLIVMDRKYGRGADVRFKVDSYVLVIFQPDNEVELNQYAGRSSRTMKQHYC